MSERMAGRRCVGVRIGTATGAIDREAVITYTVGRGRRTQVAMLST